MHRAALGKHLYTIQALYGAGGFVEATDDDGRYVLHVGSALGDRGVV